VASIFSVEEYAKQERSMKQAVNRVRLLDAETDIITNGSDKRCTYTIKIKVH
jgi:hypothetical protein